MSLAPLYKIEVLDPLPCPRMVVYRLYDESMVLLYVGVSAHWRKRIRTHRQRKHWGHLIRFFRLEEITGTRRDAELIESAAIRAERPLHNVAGHPDFIQTEYGAGASL